MCAKPETGAVCCTVVELDEVEEGIAEGVGEERDVLCLVGGTEGHGGRGQEGNTRGGVGCDTAVTVFWSPELELEVVGRLRQRAPSPRSSLLPQLLPPPSSDKLPQQRGTLLYISP